MNDWDAEMELFYDLHTAADAIEHAIRSCEKLAQSDDIDEIKGQLLGLASKLRSVMRQMGANIREE